MKQEQIREIEENVMLPAFVEGKSRKLRLGRRGSIGGGDHDIVC